MLTKQIFSSALVLAMGSSMALASSIDPVTGLLVDDPVVPTIPTTPEPPPPPKVPDPPSISYISDETIYVGYSYYLSPYITGDNRSCDFDGMPPGISDLGESLSGTPKTPGEYEVEIECTNEGGSDRRKFTLTVVPGPGGVGTVGNLGALQNAPFEQRLYILGSDPVTSWVTGLPQGLSWDAENEKIVGTPTEAGSFNVTVYALNEHNKDGVPASKSFDLRVRTLNDANLNGLPDEMDAVLGDVLGGSAPQILQLPHREVTVSTLNFVKAGKDSFTFVGEVDMPAGLSFTGQKVAVSVGGKAFAFTLKKNGVGTIKGARFAFHAKKDRFGVTKGGRGPFVLRISKADLVPSLADDGFVQNVGKQNKQVKLVLPVDIYFNSKLYWNDARVDYYSTMKAGYMPNPWAKQDIKWYLSEFK